MNAMRISRLTERQRSCLRYVHAHMSSKEIATQLGIGPGTVDQHIKAAMLVLGVGDRREAAQMLVDHEAAASKRPIATPPKIATSVRHGLRNVLNFSGRDTREQYWSYAMFLLVAGATIVFFIIQPPLMMAAMRIKQRAAEQDSNVLQLSYDNPELVPDLPYVSLVLGLLTLAHVLLIAAAIARRRHDWRLAELWGFLPLPVANLAFWLQPKTILELPAFVMIFGLFYGLIRGGAPERITAGVFLVGSFISTATLWAPAGFAGDADAALLAMEFAGLVGFLVLALRANRIWPIWATAITALDAVTHLITVMNPMVVPAAYGVIAAVGAYPLFLLLIAGTRNHRRRLRLYGIDPAWTPLARLRGAAMPGQD